MNSDEAKMESRGLSDTEVTFRAIGEYLDVM